MIRDRLLSYEEDDLYIKKDHRIDLILEKIDEEDHVLDIGCVQHSATRAVQEDQWLHGEIAATTDHLVGLDYLKEEVEKLNNMGYNVIHGNAENFQIDGEFDIIVAGEIIEHLSNPGQFLSRISYHLKPDGEFLLTTPNPWYMIRFFQSFFGDVPVNPEHTCWFSIKTLEEILSRYELEIKNSYCTRPPKKRPRLSSSNIASLIARRFYSLGITNLFGYSIFLSACLNQS